MKQISLYDYLGRAAGPELGKAVAYAAAVKKIKVTSKQVENLKYSGPILMYPKSFLDEYFGGGGDTTGKQLLKG